MSKKTKLFKAGGPNLTKASDYLKYIEGSLKPLGFSNELDAMFYGIKVDLFKTLHKEIEDAGASYDPVIAFQSIVDDFVETFEEVAPSLLEKQRRQQVQVEADAD